MCEFPITIMSLVSRLADIRFGDPQKALVRSIIGFKAVFRPIPTTIITDFVGCYEPLSNHYDEPSLTVSIT